jgi:hypothetical protein
MMSITKFLLFGLICTIALLSITNIAYAEQGKTDDAIYANGGIGQEEADEMRTKAGSFNLRLYLSEGKQGQSITDAQITITDKKGNVRLDLSGGGPMLFVHLENGNYKISANYNGTSITRNVAITSRRGVNVYLNWKHENGDVDNNTEDGLSQEL